MKIPMKVTDYPESDLLPAAKYNLTVEDVSELKTSDKGVDFLTVTFVVNEGEYVNRKLVEGYVPFSEGALLRKIIEASVEKPEKFSDTDELIGAQLVAQVRALPATAKRDESNRISTYYRFGATA